MRSREPHVEARIVALSQRFFSMRIHPLTGLAIMESADFAKAARCAGISAWGGVLVLFDDDHDERVVELLGELTEGERAELVAVHECKGCVTMFWRSWIPRRFQVCELLVAGDVWALSHVVGNGALRQCAGSLDLATVAM